MKERNEKIVQVEVTKIIKIKIIRGKGTAEDPVREVLQYWDMNGNLIKDLDSYFLETISLASSDNNS